MSTPVKVTFERTSIEAGGNEDLTLEVFPQGIMIDAVRRLDPSVVDVASGDTIASWHDGSGTWIVSEKLHPKIKGKVMGERDRVYDRFTVQGVPVESEAQSLARTLHERG